jgi:hypothetical protein
LDRLANLIDLEDGVDKDSQVGHAEADNLNGVLEPQGIPCQEQNVEEAENEEGQKRRNRAVLRLELVVELRVVLILKTELEPPKRISTLSGQRRNGCIETVAAYDSKVTQITACRPTMRKKSFAHLESRNSEENSFFLAGAALPGAPEAIMALSR